MIYLSLDFSSESLKMIVFCNIFFSPDLLDFQNPAGLGCEKPVGFAKPNRFADENYSKHKCASPNQNCFRSEHKYANQNRIFSRSEHKCADQNLNIFCPEHKCVDANQINFRSAYKCAGEIFFPLHKNNQKLSLKNQK